MLVKNGFDKKNQSLSNLIVSLIIGLLVPLVYAKYYKPNREIKTLNYLLIVMMMTILTGYLLIINVSDSTLFIVMYCLNSVFQNTVDALT